ncbi:MAG: hypothetical protein V1800_15250 [Candidatus Latescibacterota bacterium]
MDRGQIFERNGTRYEVLQEGIEYVKTNQSLCIKPGAESHCVAIKTAARNGLIREQTGAPSGDLFSNQVEKAQGEREEELTTCDSPSSASEHSHTRAVCPKRDNLYFMPVDQLRAQVFLVHGLIYPAVYDKAGLSTSFDDTQRQSPSKLTLFETPQPLNKNQLLLEILLHPDEIDVAERRGSVLQLATPLPISRLAGIGVSPAAGDLDRYVRGWVKPDVPVPRHLFKPTPVHSDPDKESPERDTESVPEHKDSIAKFDRYLGVMAFLRNADRYFSGTVGRYADYPDVFFSVCERVVGRSDLARPGSPAPDPLLLALLDLEEEITPTAKSLLDLAKSQDPYIEKEKGRKLATEIYEDAGKNATLAEAFRALFNGDYRTAIRTLQNPGLPLEAAVLSALFHFSGR